MATYSTLELPGAVRGDRRRMLGVTSLGQAAFISRTCRSIDPAAARIRAVSSRPAGSSPLFAGLVEIGEGASWIWVAETAAPAVPLIALSEQGPLPPELACFLALRLCQGCATLPAPHLRLSPRNVFVRTTGEPLIVGAGWARLLPPEKEDSLYMPEPVFEDPRADAFAAAEMARILAGGEARWDAFDPAVRSALERAGAGARRTWMLRPGELAALLERAMGPELVAGCAAQLAARVPPQPATPSVPPNAVPLQITPFELAAPEEAGPAEGARSLGLDGRIVEERRELASVQVLASPVGEHRAAESSGLELDEAALAHALTAPPTQLAVEVSAQLRHRRRRGAVRAMIAVLVLLVLGGAAAGGWLWLQAHPGAALLPAAVRHTRKAMIRVDSEPQGAQVRVGDEVLGQTPYLGDNDLPEGEYNLRIEKDGFEPVTFSIQGGEPVRLKAKLAARRSRK